MAFIATGTSRLTTPRSTVCSDAHDPCLLSRRSEPSLALEDIFLDPRQLDLGSSLFCIRCLFPPLPACMHELSGNRTEVLSGHRLAKRLDAGALGLSGPCILAHMWCVCYVYRHRHVTHDGLSK